MGAAMGQDCAIMEEVCRWVMGAAKVPVWAKLTPNVTHIQDGCDAAHARRLHGVSAINTILCVTGVDLDTLRPSPPSKATPRPADTPAPPFARSRCAW
jgi:dihydropyrimidine dehydrogenase (NADP+)/dihydropyrimidine dehydrogenase (NAD+) subunit PreA